MKKLLIALLLLIPALTFAQSTTTLPTGTTAYTPQFRYSSTAIDSLKQIWVYSGGKYNRWYTATEIVKLFGKSFTQKMDSVLSASNNWLNTNTFKKTVTLDNGGMAADLTLKNGEISLYDQNFVPSTKRYRLSYNNGIFNIGRDDNMGGVTSGINIIGNTISDINGVPFLKQGDAPSIAQADTNYVKRNPAAPQVSNVKLSSAATNVYGTTPNVLSLTGATSHNIIETAYSNSRPVATSWLHTANPSQALSGASDFHYLDIKSTTNNPFMSNGRLYPFEVITEYTGSGTLLGAWSGYFQQLHSGTGTITEGVGARFKAQVTNGGTITRERHIYIEPAVLTGGASIGTLIGVSIDGGFQGYGIKADNLLNYFEGLTANTSFTNNGTSTLSGRVGIGLSPTTSYRAEVRDATLPQARLSYDSSNGTTLTTNSTGQFNITPSAGLATLNGQLVSVSTTSPQLSVQYSGANKTDFTTSSSGNLSINPSGGNATVAGQLSSTSFQTTSANQNLYISSALNAVAQGSNYAFLSSTNQYGRTVLGNPNAISTTIPTGNSYFNTMIGPSTYTVAAGAVLPNAANFVVKPFGTQGGTGTTTNSYTMVIDGDPTNGTSTNVAFLNQGKSVLNGSVTNNTLTASSIVKTDGTKTLTSAVAGTDYLTPSGTENVGNKTLRPTNIYQSNTGTTADSLAFVSSQKHVSKQLVAGSGIGITQTASTVTIAAQTNVVEITGTTQTAAGNTIYIPHNSALTTITVPATTTIGTLYQVIGEGTGGWKLQLPAGYTAVGVGSFTTTSGGSLNSTDKNCTITIRLTNTNKFTVTTSQGTINPL